MRICPFCGAEIEENARFCLYCMSPLTEKRSVTAPRAQKRWWLWLTAVLVLCALGGVLLLRHPAPGETDPLPSETAATTPTDSAETTATAAPAAEPPAITTTVTTTATSTTTTTSTALTTTTTTTATTTATVTTNSTTADTTATVTTTDGVPSSTTTSTTAVTVPALSEIRNCYYRAATADDYDMTHSTVPLEEAIVITGFERLPDSRRYKLPATVDGKIVVGIDMRMAQGVAFDVAYVCREVQALYLPPTVNCITYDLFTEFTNLTDLYIGSPYFYLEPSALPAFEERRTTLTIHTPQNACCTLTSQPFADCCISLYSALHANWVPSDVYTEDTP